MELSKGNNKRPWELLPLPHPKEFDPGPAYFYNNFVQPLIKDMIRVMDTGIPVDQESVESLRGEVARILEEVENTLHNNPIIKKYQKLQHIDDTEEYKKECLKSVRTIDYYLKDYKPGDMIHRTWVVNAFLEGKSEPPRDKWSVADIKKVNEKLQVKFLDLVVEKSAKIVNSPSVKRGMRNLAEYKLDLWNRPRVVKSEQEIPLPRFNPGSSKQKQRLFDMLGINATTKSDKTGDDSWNRKNIELLLSTTEDPELIELLEAFIDYSFGAIIKNNFMSAFDRFTINGVLHGNIKLFGAKTFRPTSNSPNLLNMPSSASRYAKPLKKCFIAPKGKVVYAADLSALEDRVIANLTDDTNKKNVFLEGLDGHSLNACGYYPEEVAEVLGENTDNVAYVKVFMQHVEDKNEVLVTLRFKGKGVTFKLAYGGFPDKHKGGVITQELFDNYHNVLYPGITDYRENYVLKTAQDQGYIHLGLGCRIYTDDAYNDIRTLHNATVQFWSILTMIAINEIHARIDEKGYQDRIQVSATIYDSIYFIVDEDPEIIKWLNDNIIPIMCVQYLDDEPIRNEAKGEIGRNWADLHDVENNASVKDIQTILEEL